MANDPTGRALQLLSLLQTHRYWAGTELAERLGVTERTLRRDVDRLRGLGYPVDANPGVGGGYRLGTGTHLPPLVLDDDEAVAIAVGLRVAAGATIAGIEDTSLRALAKLEQVLPDRLRRRVGAIHGAVATLSWSSDQQATIDADALAILAQACRDHEEVRFDYQRRDGEQTSRLVQPEQLVAAGHRWYLVAWDLRRDDWRTFRIDRLTGARLAGARFQPRQIPGGDAAEFVQASITSMPRSLEATVVASAPAEDIRSSLHWIDHTIHEVSATRSRVHLRADSLDWLVSTVAQLAMVCEVTVESPPELGEAVAHLARRLTRQSPGGRI